eukprot:TRINITY_DN14945_c0_g1_i6.p1 TRINITY_DN14945_c0_g1~~TRINITY_DN14945_c0_g1_i6.p1  ORF type:complete len:263 (+),score=58.80 TRINITY_DN14945_c0_g1_i6:449-1237(+)
MSSKVGCIRVRVSCQPCPARCGCMFLIPPRRVAAAQQEALNNTAVAGDPDQEEDEPLSKKEQRAKEKREAKQDARRERAEADDRKRDKQSMRDAKYADRDREREEMEAQLEKEEAEREAEREKLAEAELAEWKDMFSVGEAGNEADQEISESQGKLAEFIDHIEQQKVIAMEDLAAHFGMRPQAVLKRIEDLMAMGRLSGVIDDRGKFISITNEELKEVAKFIRRRGRVNVSDLAAESNKLIDLTPKPLPAAPANAPIEIVG